ncbi:hypothetical protein ACQ4PT_028366 [Festuca glaucescens]
MKGSGIAGQWTRRLGGGAEAEIHGRWTSARELEWHGNRPAMESAHQRSVPALEQGEGAFAAGRSGAVERSCAGGENPAGGEHTAGGESLGSGAWKAMVGFRLQQASGVGISFGASTIMKVLYTNMASSVEAWLVKAEGILDASARKIVGLDVEYDKSRDSYNSKKKAAVIQLCYGNDVLVYHIYHADENCPKLRLPVHNLKDIQQIWRGHEKSWKRTQGLKDVAGAIIDPYYEKMKDGFGNREHNMWANAPLLPEKHLEYAARDAYATYEVKKLVSRKNLFVKGGAANVKAKASAKPMPNANAKTKAKAKANVKSVHFKDDDDDFVDVAAEGSSDDESDDDIEKVHKEKIDAVDDSEAT